MIGKGLQIDGRGWLNVCDLAGQSKPPSKPAKVSAPIKTKKKQIKLDDLDYKLIEVTQEYDDEKATNPKLRFPTNRSLADQLDSSKSKIARRLKRLRGAGYIPKTTRDKAASYEPSIVEQMASDGRGEVL